MQKEPEIFDLADLLHPLDDSGPPKTMDELMAEGKITARQYRSLLFLMQTGPSFSTESISFDIEEKIEELTRIIESETGSGNK
jgi:hypothetical protein